jgi:hypothetical protein
MAHFTKKGTFNRNTGCFNYTFKGSGFNTYRKPLRAAGQPAFVMLGPPSAVTSRCSPAEQHRVCNVIAHAAAQEAPAAAPEAATDTEKTLICTSITAPSMDSFLAEMQEATGTGVDILELRLDFIKDFNPEQDLERLMKACTIPYIITYRPTWEWWVSLRVITTLWHTLT